MIVVEANLVSAISQIRNEHLCTLTISNLEDRGARADYRVRLYSRGETPRLIRSAEIENWPKRMEPAWRLIQAAFEALEKDDE